MIKPTIEEFISNRGGRFLDTAENKENNDFWIECANVLERDINARLGFLRANLYKNNNHKVLFYISKHSDFIAQSYAGPEIDGVATDLIYISIGLIKILNRAFNILLCHPKIFPDFGIAWDESPERAEIFSFTSEALRTYDFDQPNNLQRHYLSLELSYIAINFIVQHEFGHLLLGHLEIREKYLENEQFRQDLEADSASLQWLELQADGDAVLRTLDTYITISEFIPEIVITGNIKDELCHKARSYLFGDRKRTVEAVTFAILASYRIHEQNQVEGIPTTKTHPPNRVRMFATIGRIEQYCRLFQNVTGFKYEYFQAAVPGILGNVERCIASVTNSTPNFENPLALMFGEERDSIESYMQQLPGSRELLQEQMFIYSRADLPRNLPRSPRGETFDIVKFHWGERDFLKSNPPVINFTFDSNLISSHIGHHNRF